VDEFGCAYSKEGWGEATDLGKATDDVELILVSYECVQDPDAHFLGVFFEKVPHLSHDVVIFEGAG